MQRRAFLKQSTMAVAGAAAGALGAPATASLEARRQAGSSIAVDPKPLFELSPYLYMQFMEPLGATDGSVEAAWDHARDQWREDVVEVTTATRADDDAVGRHLRGFLSMAGRRRTARRASPHAEPAVGRHRIEPGGHRRIRRTVPTRWRGAADLRQLRIGRAQAVHEGRGQRAHGRRAGSGRVGGVLQRLRTIAERKAHGHAAPWDVRHWQIGNETSYDKNGFDLETAARKTVEFAKAMRAADPAHSTDRVGRQRLGGAHGGGGRRTRPVPRVPSHVRSRFAAEAGAARRAVPARSGRGLGSVDGGVAADRHQDSHACATVSARGRFRSH